jgi:hypothetical protein
MAEPVKTKKVRKPKKQKVKQGHKLVWLTLAIILIPALLVGYVLFTSAEESGQPVEGSRFGINDLNPAIQDSQIAAIQSELMQIGGVESATVNLNSATLRIHLNAADVADDAALGAIAEAAYQIVDNYLPVDTYFTNSADGKNYDLEIDAYNYLVDDAHPIDGWNFIKIVKNSSGEKIVENMTEAKNWDLAQAVKNGTAY